MLNELLVNFVYVFEMKLLKIGIGWSKGILLISMLLFSACEQYNTPNTNPNELKVKRETIWNCDIQTEKKTTIYSIKEFDINGNLILFEQFNDDGIKLTEMNYTYEQQKSIEYKKVYKPTGEIDSVSKSFIIFDLSGKVLSKIVQSSNGDTISILNYSYDNAGNITKKIEIKPKTNIQNETVYSYTYNSEGNLIERVTNPTNDGFYVAKDSIIYKPSESSVERIFYESYGQISSIFTYFYNSLGRIVKEFEKDKQGNVVKKYIYEYIYW